MVVLSCIGKHRGGAGGSNPNISLQHGHDRVEMRGHVTVFNLQKYISNLQREHKCTCEQREEEKEKERKGKKEK